MASVVVIEVVLMVAIVTLSQVVLGGCPANLEGFPAGCRCLTAPQKVEVECKNSNMSVIPKDFNVPYIKQLIITQNNIEVLTYLSMPKSLTLLNLAQNGIEVIQDGAFQNMSNLIELDLSSNKVERLNKATFPGLRQLISLDLSGNKIRFISHDVFTDLKSLRTLDLSANRISEIITHSFSSMANLRHLNLSDNRMQEVQPKVFSNLSKVEVLDLSHNQIMFIHDETFTELTQLLQLFVHHNTLEGLATDSMLGLTKLKTLELHCNILFSIEEKAFADFYNSLRELTLHDNKLNRLDPNLLPWIHLYEITLSENPWLCDCHSRWMSELDIIVKQNAVNFRCSQPDDLREQEITQLSPDAFHCESVDPHRHDMALVVGVIMAVFMVSLLVGLALFINRHKLRCLKKLKTVRYTRGKRTQEVRIPISTNESRPDEEQEELAPDGSPIYTEM